MAARAARALVAAIGIGVCGIAPAPHDHGDRVLGRGPAYGPAMPSPMPNAAAIEARIWVPGLDDGFDPQGLTLAAGSLFVSGYESTDFWKMRGPCQVFRIDPASGGETARFAVPMPCGHAGGLAAAGDGRLYLSDTWTLFELGHDGAVRRRWPLGPGLRGAYATSGDGAVWIGTYRQGTPGTIFAFATSVLDALPDGAVLQASMAARTLPVPSYVQGAAIDRDGRLWVARSEIAWGSLERLDPATGAVAARYPAAGGIEGIAFDGNGRLWAVSEAGARHLGFRYPFHPLIFRIDPNRLQLMPGEVVRQAADGRQGGG